MQQAATSQKPTAPELPPDEQFWQTYSPHHEAPISSIGSVLVHLALFGLLIALSLGLLSFAPSNDTVPMEVVTAGELSQNEPSTGGGSPGNEPENVQQSQEPNSQPQPLEPVPAVRVQVSDLPPLLKDDATFAASFTDQTETAKRIGELDDQTRQDLFRSINKGRQNKGGSGGVGQGPDKGKGNSTGPSAETSRRTMRWTMKFQTADGRDYIRQLKAMQAILVFPYPNGKRTMYDLSKPNYTPEPAREINRMFWIDNSAESMQGLAMTLRINPYPRQMIAYFPQELEQRLLAEEMNYQQANYGMKNEDAIRQTTFDILVDGNGYRIRVDSMQLK